MIDLNKLRNFLNKRCRTAFYSLSDNDEEFLRQLSSKILNELTEVQQNFLMKSFPELMNVLIKNYGDFRAVFLALKSDRLKLECLETLIAKEKSTNDSLSFEKILRNLSLSELLQLADPELQVSIIKLFRDRELPADCIKTRSELSDALFLLDESGQLALIDYLGEETINKILTSDDPSENNQNEESLQQTERALQQIELIQYFLKPAPLMQLKNTLAIHLAKFQKEATALAAAKARHSKWRTLFLQEKYSQEETAKNKTMTGSELPEVAPKEVVATESKTMTSPENLEVMLGNLIKIMRSSRAPFDRLISFLKNNDSQVASQLLTNSFVRRTLVTHSTPENIGVAEQFLENSPAQKRLLMSAINEMKPIRTEYFDCLKRYNKFYYCTPFKAKNFQTLNALALLSNYIRGGALGRFFSGHWNRSTRNLVAVESILNEKGISSASPQELICKILFKLRINPKQDIKSQLNNGSLYRRLFFIAQKNDDFLENIYRESPLHKQNPVKSATKSISPDAWDGDSERSPLMPKQGTCSIL